MDDNKISHTRTWVAYYNKRWREEEERAAELYNNPNEIPGSIWTSLYQEQCYMADYYKRKTIRERLFGLPYRNEKVDLWYRLFWRYNPAKIRHAS